MVDPPALRKDTKMPKKDEAPEKKEVEPKVDPYMATKFKGMAILEKPEIKKNET